MREHYYKLLLQFLKQWKKEAEGNKKPKFSKEYREGQLSVLKIVINYLSI